MKILVTGSNGFVGKNVRSILHTLDHEVITFDKSDDITKLADATRDCDAVIHLAGVNRPKDNNEFYEGNAGLTEILCQNLAQNKNACPVILSSSIQATRDNDYGKSKKMAEDSLLDFGKKNGNKVYIFRFKNLYGKWSRPNYNSVVATWCYNISHNLEIVIDNPETEIELCYIDDVVTAIIEKLDGKQESGYYEIGTTDTVTLKDLYDTLCSFKDTRASFAYPNQLSRLSKNLYATYLHYLPEDNFSYTLNTNTDERGTFTEVLKSTADGQISINVSKPGITKGQHWHSSKNEKFLVVSGEGVVQLRDFFSDKVIEYTVSEKKLEVVDIPTGYVHNLINSGEKEMITLIWANELFDKNNPDTNYQEV